MHGLLRIFLKLFPFLAGLAWVLHGLEKKQKPVFSWRRVLGALLMLGGIFVLVVILHVRAYYEVSFTGQSEGCAVVFGAAVWREDQPSHALDDRVQAAIELYKNGQVRCLVFSGGASKYGAHEVAVMIKLAAEAQVPLAAIRPDWQGNNTLATILNLAAEPGYVLVSNDFHLARINAMAQKVGLQAYHLHAAPYQYGRYTKEAYFFGREILGTPLVWLGL